MATGDYNPPAMIFSLVLDTNVVLDLFHFADPMALPILKALETGKIVCWSDEATLAELERVLTYPELNLSNETAAMLLERYQKLTRLVEVGNAPPLPRCKDPDDQMFLELAARAKTSLLISKDKALLALAGKPGLPFQIMAPKNAVATIYAALRSNEP
ncbi:MAG: putative toxin-antitoxin system toxin component, family [Proteobacteria bacterium]|nr:putative toxin-antitoxin system toxin component, family [Pseudomonadota bacterium]